PTSRGPHSAYAASATAGSIATSAFTCRRRCTRGAASIDSDFHGHALRALPRLAEVAGFLPRAARYRAARASDVPHVLAGAERRVGAARPPVRPPTGAGGESGPRPPGSGDGPAHALGPARSLRPTVV